MLGELDSPNFFLYTDLGVQHLNKCLTSLTFYDTMYMKQGKENPPQTKGDFNELRNSP